MKKNLNYDMINTILIIKSVECVYANYNLIQNVWRIIQVPYYYRTKVEALTTSEYLIFDLPFHHLKSIQRGRLNRSLFDFAKPSFPKSRKSKIIGIRKVPFPDCSMKNCFLHHLQLFLCQQLQCWNSMLAIVLLPKRLNFH